MAFKLPPKDKEKQGVAKVWKQWVWDLAPETYNAQKLMMVALERAVESSAKDTENENDEITAQGWLTDLFDEETYEKLFSSIHMGNFIIIRSTKKRDFEEMPIYARIGMHLLFYGSVKIRLLRWSVVRSILKQQSIRQGQIYDEEGPQVVKRINDFIKTYNIDMKEVLIKDPSGYKTFNEFFYRKLKPNARAPSSRDLKDSTVIVSAADCRLTVFSSLAQARQFWVKGKNFTLPALLGSNTIAARFGESPSVAIFRLAPQDYHRYHSPVEGTVESITTLAGEYYTVNPMAVNQEFDVFTANRRDVLLINAKLDSSSGTTVPVAFIGIGALLVGSVNWTKKAGDVVAKGEDLGWFAYGGSTVVCVFGSEGRVVWDEDVLSASEGRWTGEEDATLSARLPKDFVLMHKEGETLGMEVLVKAGERIGAAKRQ